MSADPLPVGAVLASALMAASYPGDSGEDVDRLIAELDKRGYALVPLASETTDAGLVAEAIRRVEGLPVASFADDITDADFYIVQRSAVLAILRDLADA